MVPCMLGSSQEKMKSGSFVTAVTMMFHATSGRKLSKIVYGF